MSSKGIMMLPHLMSFKIPTSFEYHVYPNCHSPVNEKGVMLGRATERSVEED